LTPIEGIGPKINQVLHDAGIATFAQLAGTEVSRLQQILSDANLRLANADTWPEQAKLAAAGDWEELKRLQDELDAGVRR
jgi:predicted flap endonuclease-1-like 5' DNA nuclease